MSRFCKLALSAALALSLAAALLVGCSDDEQQEQPQQQVAEQPQTEPQQTEQADDAQSSSSQTPASQPQQSQQDGQRGQQDQPQQEEPAEPLDVVVSTQIIADWVRQVGGDRVNVRALMPAGADVHTLELSVSDIRAVADADLVIINGAGLEAAYQDAILENSDRILDLAEAIEVDGFTLAPFSAMVMELEHEEHDDHDGHDDHGDDDAHDHEGEHEQHEEHDDHGDHEDEHGSVSAIGRLLITDAESAQLSVIDLSSGEISSGVFEVAAPGARVYPSPSHRYGIVLARGPEDDDDRVHLFDGGVFEVEHGDHFDLVTQPVSRHAFEIAEELPIHFVNSYGWSAIFTDARGRVFMIDEAALISSQGDYQPIVLDAGPQHGAALAISEEHVIVSSNNPDFPEESDSSLPLGVEVRDLNDAVIYDASDRSCPGLHGESHNAHGAAFGCTGGVLFLHAHDGEYEHEFIANPPEMRSESRIGSVYGHHHVEHFFGRASYFDGQGFADDGIWLIDVARGGMRQVFSEPSVNAMFSSDGEMLYVLGIDGVLHGLDAHDGDLHSTMQLAAPGEAGAPAFTIAGEMLYLVDPNSGHAWAVHLEDMEIEAEWHLRGAPASVAFVGLIKAGHDDHDDHDGHGDHDGHEDHEQHEEEEHDGHDHHGHAHGDEDPHFWFDTDLAQSAVAAIADALIELDPSSAGTISDLLDTYQQAIRDADASVKALLADLPDNRRLLVTFHDAFGYFARRYGLEVAGFVVEGPEQGVSAGALTRLIELIEREGVETVFHEPQFDSTILDTVADETGAGRGIIWSQPTDDNPTYIGILVGNAQAIAGQLGLQ